MPTTKPLPKNGRIGTKLPHPEVLTLAEAASYLRIPEAEVLRMIREQHLPGRRIGDEWRFSRIALEDWLGAGVSARDRLLSLAGAWKDDPHLEAIVREAYRRRAHSIFV